MEKIQPTLFRMIVNPSMPVGNSQNFAMFDLDHCIVKPKDGRKFPRDAKDWEWTFPEVPKKLSNITDRIIIITNQMQTAKSEDKRQASLNKIETKLKDIFSNIPKRIEIYIPIAKDKWRKPNTTIFEKYLMTDTVPKCFYVGDAAGRPDDHSDTDRAFAYNLYHLFKYRFPNLAKSDHPKFYTESQYFAPDIQTEDKPTWRCFDPSKFLRENPPSQHLFNLDTSKKWFILMVGAPASGKSSLAKDLQIPHVIVSQDQTGSKRKALAQTRDAIAAGKNVIIDNTHPSLTSRKEYLDLAPPEYTTCIIFMDVGRETIQHLNGVRVRKGGPRIPKVVYNVFYKKFEHPLPVEADVLFIVPFTPIFKTKRDLLDFIQRTECA